MSPKQIKTHGLIAAAPTAFREDGSVDFDFIPPMAEHLFGGGAAGVFVNGTTGEGLSLTVEERCQQAEAWRKATPSDRRMFVHVGNDSLPVALELARHAASIGADAVAALAPIFFKPGSIDELADWCAALAGAVPELPFYYYHMPSLTGAAFRMNHFLKAAGPRIPNLAGIKFTFEAMDDFLLCQRLEEARYDMLWGRDEMLLGALATGATGGVGSTYNIDVGHYLKLIEAYEADDFERARRLQAEACEMIEALLAAGPFFAAIKYALQQLGLPITPRTRAPLPGADALNPAPIDAWLERRRQ